MFFRIKQGRQPGEAAAGHDGFPFSRVPGLRGLVPVVVCAAAIAWASGMVSIGQTGPQSAPHPILLPEANRPPDANDQMVMREEKDDQQDKNKDIATANIERRKQIADDSAKLLKLAGDLKTAVDKTGKDTLSLEVIRKADEIERLAHSVKEKMKLTMGAS
jgi:hypothetical protein